MSFHKTKKEVVEVNPLVYVVKTTETSANLVWVAKFILKIIGQ